MRNKKYYVRQQVMETTAEIAQISTGDTGRMGRDIRNAIEYVAYAAAINHDLKNGQTALFWHLVAVVNQHLKNKE